MINQIIQNCVSNELKRKALEAKTLTLAELIVLGKLDESITLQIKEFNRNKPVNKDIHAVSSASHVRAQSSADDSNQNAKSDDAGGHKGQSNELYAKSNRKPRVYGDGKKKCKNCGGRYPHEKRCPAQGVECHNCGRLNHYAKCCLSNKVKSQKSVTFDRKSSVRKLNQFDRTGETSDSSGSSKIWQLKNKLVNAVKSFLLPTVTLLICGAWVDIAVDTGSEDNISSITGYRSKDSRRF